MKILMRRSVDTEIETLTKSKNSKLRAKALSFLGHSLLQDNTNKNRISELAIRALKEDHDPIVRKAAVHVMYRLRNWESLEALIQALADQDSSVRMGVVESLGYLWWQVDEPYGYPSCAISGLLQALGDKDLAVRMQAFTYLKMADEKIVEAEVDKMILKAKSAK
jgi:HEAT repeat protein